MQGDRETIPFPRSHVFVGHDREVSRLNSNAQSTRR